ncbi:MAG: LPS export ABC transporter periplasmic protein LptC [Bacteroidia bacterium]|nr:LPS export ABC transporter periplasmic protein LptC [Bacteroidia bacterium]
MYYWFVSLLLVTSMFYSCSDNSYYAGDTIPRDLVNIERVDSVTITYSDSAKVQVIITAPLLLRHIEFNNNRQEFTEGVHVKFLNEDGSMNGTLEAEYAIRYEAKQGVIVQNNVVWSSIDGKRLESEELIWDEKNKKIHTQKLVRIVTPTENVYGYGLEADQDFSNWRILAPLGDLSVPNLKD